MFALRALKNIEPPALQAKASSAMDHGCRFDLDPREDVTS
jgi:hypothetical protein